jgi:hypothetical protein
VNEADGNEPEGRDALTPLEKARSQQENALLASLLEEHDRLRGIRLQVVLYGEQRQQEGSVPQDQIDRECAELNDALLRQYVKEKQAKLSAAKPVKSQSKFAEAFEVKGASDEGASFDRARQEASRAAAERQRREALLQLQEERGKKPRTE